MRRLFSRRTALETPRISHGALTSPPIIGLRRTRRLVTGDIKGAPQKKKPNHHPEKFKCATKTPPIFRVFFCGALKFRGFFFAAHFVLGFFLNCVPQKRKSNKEARREKKKPQRATRVVMSRLRLEYVWTPPPQPPRSLNHLVARLEDNAEVGSPPRRGPRPPAPHSPKSDGPLASCLGYLRIRPRPPSLLGRRTTSRLSPPRAR